MTETAMRDALRASQGNVAQAARALGISRSTLYRRVGATARRQ
jgi:transcriptional regulator of acetoin/glycerol metabolism